jgi:hypothetical protein
MVDAEDIFSDETGRGLVLVRVAAAVFVCHH